MNCIEESRRLVDKAFANAEQSAVHLAAAQGLLAARLKEHPDCVATLTCLGAVLCDQANHRKAIRVLEKAVKLGSSDRNTYFNLGVALVALGARKEAMANFKRAQGLDAWPESWAAYFDAQAQ